MSSGTYLELHVPDFDTVKEFYGRLGFAVVWEREPEGKKGYLVLMLEQNVLMFWGGNKYIYEQGFFKRYPNDAPRGNGVEIVIMIDDVLGYYDRIKGDVEVFRAPKTRPWGVVDFRVVDPVGFYLRITQPYDVLDPKYSVE